MRILPNRMMKFSTLWAITIMILLSLFTLTAIAQTKSPSTDKGLATLRVYNVAISVPDID